MTGGNSSAPEAGTPVFLGRDQGNAGVGIRGEELASAYLERNGLKIVERNFRCKGGEIDIIAQEGKTLVFVEVKSRKNLSYGVPQLSVTPFKQRQISKAALTWLAKTGQQDLPARFDVIAILLSGDTTFQLEHIRNAFDLAY